MSMKAIHRREEIVDADASDVRSNGDPGLEELDVLHWQERGGSLAQYQNVEESELGERLRFLWGAS